jgi:murein DD-endopeptidase MepM/ murein hydrolase activator NlpD
LDRRRRFSLLIVRGDGVRVLRFNFGGAVAIALLAVFGVTVLAGGALVGDYVQLRELTRDAVGFTKRLTEQQQFIDSVNRRIAELRTEVAAWRELHARIWEPFGPDASPKRAKTGIGGAAVAVDRAAGSPADELNWLAESVMEEGRSLRALEQMISRAAKALASMPSRWPVRGAVNSEFGTRTSQGGKLSEFHGGIDIGAERGTPVRAPAAGTVVFAGAQAEYGITIMLEHGQDIRTVYGHLSKLHVKLGDTVERGALIGLTGNTGRSTGPHLHYEILVKGQPVNPRRYLWD